MSNRHEWQAFLTLVAEGRTLRPRDWREYNIPDQARPAFTNAVTALETIAATGERNHAREKARELAAALVNKYGHLYDPAEELNPRELAAKISRN